MVMGVNVAAAVPARTHARRVAPYDEVGLDGSLPPDLNAELELAWRIVGTRGRGVPRHELLGALSACGFNLNEKELLAVAGPELLGQPILARADFRSIYLRLTATDMTLDQSVRRAFGIFDEEQEGKLNHKTLRRVLAAAAGGDVAAADRRIAALGIPYGGELDVREFASELRATLAATAALLTHSASPANIG
jgi:Ca2+-binding EF-hand superfamily protein